MLYPYIQGESQWDMRLTAEQWRGWGGVMRSIHDAAIPPELASKLPKAVFALNWLDKLEQVDLLLARGNHEAGAQAAVAQIWRENADTIDRCRSRYLSLGARLERQSPDFVLCHADIHRANTIIDPAGALHIVDWDETLLAPKERDLMFFIDDGCSAEATEAFFAGYGDTAVDPIALAYYKYDWVLQEFADYGERVFLTNNFSDAELALAQREFARLFESDDVIDRAQRAYASLISSEAETDAETG